MSAPGSPSATASAVGLGACWRRRRTRSRGCACLLVEPSARGLGIGTALTDACIGFARQCGYRRITLWTHRVLTTARHVYERAGFRLTSSEARHSWGQDVVSEHWDMALD